MGTYAETIIIAKKRFGIPTTTTEINFDASVFGPFYHLITFYFMISPNNMEKSVHREIVKYL